jgi:hypothetical protein
MRNRPSVLISCVALVAAWISPVHALPIDASMSVTGHAEVDGDSITDPETAAWVSLLDPLSLSVDATVSNSFGAFSSATASASANWGVDGNSGSVLLSGYRLRTFEGAAHYEADLNGAGPDWQYTFMADSDGIFSMTYNVAGSGVDTTGLYGWNIGWSGAGGGLNLQNASDPTESGIFSRDVIAGQTYTVSLDNNAHFGCDCTGFPSRVMDGTFEFDIGPATIPEPATVALFGAGLLALGWLLHWRKTHKD